MAYTVTYPGLKADILLKVEDESDSVINSLDEIIANGELQCLRDLDLEIFQDEFSPGNLTAHSRLFTRPSIVKVSDVWLMQTGTKRVYIERRSKGFCDMFAPDSAVEGLPKYFAETSTANLLFVDTPDQAYATRVYGIQRPPGLSDAVPTTWLSTYAADLLFHACLAATEEFLSDPNQASVWKQDYAGKMAAAKIELRGMSRSTYEMARMTGQAASPI